MYSAEIRQVTFEERTDLVDDLPPVGSTYMVQRSADKADTVAANDYREFRPLDNCSARKHLSSALELVGQGQPTALKAVYAMTWRKLYGVCFAICQNHHCAEDALQEIYINVWRLAGSFDAARASPISWPARIARNKAIDVLRTRRRESKFEPLSQASYIPDDHPSAEAICCDRRTQALLRSAVDMLTIQDAKLLRCLVFDEQTYQQIAIDLGLPLSTVKTRGRRALLKLRDNLTSSIGNPEICLG